jgi:hypothetical protein
VQAIGAKCTHYGAPLAKGILTTTGRVTCPWHGGKFRHLLCTWHADTDLVSLLQCQDW